MYDNSWNCYVERIGSPENALKYLKHFCLDNAYEKNTDIKQFRMLKKGWRAVL